jgi:acyl carrier protein
MRAMDISLEDRVKGIMADIFMIDVSQISGRSSIQTIEGWDSLAQIDLINALEEEFAVKFEVEDFELMTSFSQIVEILSEKL